MPCCAMHTCSQNAPRHAPQPDYDLACRSCELMYGVSGWVAGLNQIAAFMHVLI